MMAINRSSSMVSAVAQGTFSRNASSIEKCSASKSSRKQLTRLVTLVAFVAVVLAQSVIVPSVEARYLPTRSNVDQLKKQEIKEILRLLLDLPEEQQREQAVAWNAGLARGAMADMYELAPVRGARHPGSTGGADEAEARAKRDTQHAQLPKALF